MSSPGKVRALLATLRIANAPSVVSNVFLGYMVGWDVTQGGWDASDTSRIHWNSGLLISLSSLLLYFSGNLANDWFDRKWDKTRRPERALPSGLFRARSYFAASVILAIAGVISAFLVKPACAICALAILTLIWIYTLIHKRSIWSVVPMGLCRSGLYVIGFLATWPGLEALENTGYDSGSVALHDFALIGTLAAGLFSYIAGLSLSARYEGMEDGPEGPRVISKALILLSFPAMSCWFMHDHPYAGLIGMIPLAVWLSFCFSRFSKPIPCYVSALLAGIPLVDFIAACAIALGLAWMPWVKPYPNFDGLPHLALIMIVPLAAFATGRALQKLAPAT